MTKQQAEAIHKALDTFRIELPSWGFANTGTRFGKFVQPAAATNIEEKFSDAAQVHRWTGVCPTVAIHVLWDLAGDLSDVQGLGTKYGLQPGSINPNLFEDQIYKFGSLANPDSAVRKKAVDHLEHCVEIMKRLGSRDLSVWLADGSNYPGTQNIRRRRKWVEEGLAAAHAQLTDGQRMLVEYKPFEPAFYHTDIADWGMALLLAEAAGPKAKVLVDTGHHYQAQNIEQIVDWLLDRGMLGGFHFNDRKYADDDLTLGSIDPYAVFRIFHEIRNAADLRNRDVSDIAYMIDQSHNLKPKVEAMIQTAITAQELYAKACLVDRRKLRDAQMRMDIVDAEQCLRDAFYTDVRPMLAEWRKRKNLDANPIAAYRASGYDAKVSRERESARAARGGGASGSYA